MAKSQSFSSKFVSGFVTWFILWYFEIGKALLIWFANLFEKFITTIYRQGDVIELGISLLLTYALMYTFIGTFITEIIDSALKKKK